MDDTNITIYEEDKTSSDDSIVVLPVNFTAVGEISRDDVQIYIKQEAYKRIEKYAKEQMSKEVGSILVGEYICDDRKKYVIISDCIEAKYTDATASTLTFTHDTWAYVNKEMEKKYKDKTIVGWQHTHPGYGIFLSNYDLFIQENFFNLPWQIAYVVDPIANTRGFFQWKGDVIEKVSGFYVYDDVEEKIIIDEAKKPKSRHFSVTTLVLSLLLILSVLLTVSFAVEKSIVSDKLNAALLSLEQMKAPHIQPPPQKHDDMATFKLYTVKPGDSLEGICKKTGIDYSKNIGKIKKINDIRDVNKIYVGQELYLPIAD